jgi:hypothetical protein
MEQQYVEEPLPWENLFRNDKIEDPKNLITTTMKNFAPSISIFQYYQAYKPIILNWSSFLDIRNNIHLSHEQFWALWDKANSVANDILVFIWILKDHPIPRGVVKVTTTNPPFYITRFCILALTHISKYHEKFYSNMDNMFCLLQLELYNLDVVKDIQDMANL